MSVNQIDLGDRLLGPRPSHSPYCAVFGEPAPTPEFGRPGKIVSVCQRPMSGHSEVISDMFGSIPQISELRRAGEWRLLSASDPEAASLLSANGSPLAGLAIEGLGSTRRLAMHLRTG